MQTPFSTDAPSAQAFAISSQPHKGSELSEAQVGALRELVPYAEHWFCWGDYEYFGRAKQKNPTKVPINPRNGRMGETDNPKTAGTLRAALEQVYPRGYGRGGGVGLLMTDAENEFVGIDADDCRDPDSGRLTPFGAELVRRFAGTYIEISPSGRGLRIFCLGLAETVKRLVGGGSLEIYHAGAVRFLRVTGATLTGTAGRVTPCQDGLDWLMAQVGASGGAVPANEPPNSAGDGVARAETSASGGPNSGSGQGSSPAQGLTLEAIKAQVEALDIGIVEAELAEAWNPDPDAEAGLSAAQVVAKLNNVPTGRQGLGEMIKRLKTGREDSDDDHAICCAAVRRGALVVSEVAGALVQLAGAGGRDKLKRQDYQTRTAENALRAVLIEVRAHRLGVKAIERAGRSFLGWHFVKDQTGNEGKDGGRAWALPQGLAEALAVSGDVLVLGKTGKPLANSSNVITILRNDPDVKGLIGFDEMQQSAVRTGGVGAWAVFDRDAQEQPGLLTDDDITRVSMWLQRKYGISARFGDLVRDVEAAARSNSFNRVTESLVRFAAQWDGVPRLHTLLTKWALADSQGIEEYVSAAGRCFMVAAVARAFDPGCEVQEALILEGLKGGGKSTFFEVLSDAVAPDMFNDDVKDASQAASVVEDCGGAWIVELAELAGVRKAADVESLKSSLTRKKDKYRTPYDKFPKVHPRRFVFVGTTNRTQYIKDTSGALGRRFLPIPVLSSERNQADLNGLKAEASQLWGEAVHLYRQGVKWKIKPDDGKAFDQWESVRATRQEDGAFYDEVMAVLMDDLQKGDLHKPYKLKCMAEAVGFTKAVQGDGASIHTLAETMKAAGMESKRNSMGVVWRMSPDGANRLLQIQAGLKREAEAQAADDLFHPVEGLEK